MKGLLKNNFYGVIENLKIALAFVMLVGVLLLITGEATLLSAFSLIAPPIIALLMVSCVLKKAHLNAKNINSLSRLDEKPLLKVNILVIQYGVYLGL